MMGAFTFTFLGSAMQREIHFHHNSLQFLKTFRDQEWKNLNVHLHFLNVTQWNMSLQIRYRETTKITENLLNHMNVNVEEREQGLLMLETDACTIYTQYYFFR